VSGGFTCASCGGTTARDWRAERGWRIVRCESCGLLATWPQPDAATLTALYESPDYYDARAMGTATRRAWVSRAREIFNALPLAAGPLLDYGAGSGGLVHGARQLGVEADGVEPSATARELARSLYGVDLVPSLEECSHRSYGAITLLHVLEHVVDPLADLRALGSLLEPDGALLIEVPHAGSADMWVPSRRRMILDPPAHLHHFTPKTLRTLLEHAGYAVLDLRLFNAAAVERVLAWRSAHRRPRGPARDAASEAVSESSGRSTQPARTLWSRALASVRSALPGDRFQVIAGRAR
jgi:SAM-dependent methyltransferase